MPAADQRPPLVGVRRESSRSSGTRPIAVARLAVRERELRALEHRVHVLDAEERPELDAVEQRELLQENRPLTPRPGLEHRPAAEPDTRRLDGPRSGQIVPGEHAGVRLARLSTAGRHRGDDRLGDAPAVPRVARGVDPASRVAPPDRVKPLVGAASTGCAAAPPSGTTAPTDVVHDGSSAAIARAIPGVDGNPSRA